MGSYFGRDFLAYSHRRTFGPHEYVANVGRASAEMFSTLLPLVFAKVIPLDRFPPYNGTSPGPAVGGVIEPRIEDFAFRLGFDSDSERYNVTYRMTVFTPEGDPVTTWTVRGKAPYGNFVEIEGETVEFIQTVADKLNLKWDTAIPTSYHALFERLCAKHPELDPKELSFTALDGLNITIEELSIRAGDA